MSALLGDYFRNLQMARFASNKCIGICTNALLAPQRMNGQGNTLPRVDNTFQFRASPYRFCLSFLHCLLVNASTPQPPLLLPSLTARALSFLGLQMCAEGQDSIGFSQLSGPHWNCESTQLLGSPVCRESCNHLFCKSRCNIYAFSVWRTHTDVPRREKIAHSLSL